MPRTPTGFAGSATAVVAFQDFRAWSIGRTRNTPVTRAISAQAGQRFESQVEVSEIPER
jgi:hypothetical protein